jgi:SAM-dependent methyltransferase
MYYWSISKKLMPRSLFSWLFGNRREFGSIPIQNDSDWMAWEKVASTFYEGSQKKGIGNIVNNAGYKILRTTNLKSKDVLEIGPGSLGHQKYWNFKPKSFVIIDVDPSMGLLAAEQLQLIDIQPTIQIVSRNSLLPLKDNSIDVVISFYSLEHVLELDRYLEDVRRVLRPGGTLIGAIPAEGGLAWGFGRMITTLRWLKKSHGLNLNKIICWEHPNFANEVIKSLDKHFHRIELKAWPLQVIPLIDLNLIIKFSYVKRLKKVQNHQ